MNIPVENQNILFISIQTDYEPLLDSQFTSLTAWLPKVIQFSLKIKHFYRNNFIALKNQLIVFIVKRKQREFAVGDKKSFKIISTNIHSLFSPISPRMLYFFFSLFEYQIFHIYRQLFTEPSSVKQTCLILFFFVVVSKNLNS